MFAWDTELKKSTALALENLSLAEEMNICIAKFNTAESVQGWRYKEYALGVQQNGIQRS